MYDTAFTDRTLEYGASAYAPFGQSQPSGPVLGNGNVFIHIDASSGQMCTALRTRVGLADTLAFTEIRRETPGPLPPTKSMSLNLATGTYRSVAGSSDAECVVTLSAIRQSPAISVETVWCRDVCKLEHVLRPPNGMLVTRTDLVIRNVGGIVLPHLVVEGSIGSLRVAYCCVYAGDGVSLDGTRDPEPGTSAIHSVVRTSVPNATVSMMHATLHGANVTAAHAFRACEPHFRTNASPTESIAAVRKLHTTRWDSLWRGSLTVDATPQASPAEVEQIRTLNLHIQTSVYRLYSDMPDPNAISRSDADGLSPERQYSMMDTLALAPIAPWLPFMQPRRRPDALTPMYQVAGEVNDAWDGYRVTLDRTRLELHYPTLRHHLNELTIRIENSLPSTVTGATASTGTVRTRAGAQVSEDPYTTGVARRAFLSGEQICNALRFPGDLVWGDLRSRLLVPRANAFSTEIAGVRPPTAGEDGLVLLHPGALTTYSNSSDLGPYAQLIDGNAAALLAAATGPVCPAAFASIATLAADTPRIAAVQDRNDRLDSCFVWLMEKCSASVDALWGAASHTSTQTASDILACILYGFAKVKVRGYVTRDGIHTVPASMLPGPSTTILPRTWSVIRRRMSRSVSQQTEYLTQNVRR
jgi:hypothetical protein